MSDEDRSDFLDTLADVVGRYWWICHAYCLMDNHYHLVMETPHANLSRGMRQLNGAYTQVFNRGHGRVGHLLGIGGGAAIEPLLGRKSLLPF